MYGYRALDRLIVQLPFDHRCINAAELLVGRWMQFMHELVLHGASQKQAEAEVATAIDLWVHHTVWWDKYQALFSSVHPAETGHFNFGMYEPTGVVGVMCLAESGLLGLKSVSGPVFAGGKTIGVIASERSSLPVITFTGLGANRGLPGAHEEVPAFMFNAWVG